MFAGGFVDPPKKCDFWMFLPTERRAGGPADPPPYICIYFELFSPFQAYSLVDREVGYCQGSAFIVGLLLMQVCDDPGGGFTPFGDAGLGNGNVFLHPQGQNDLIPTIPPTLVGFKSPVRLPLRPGMVPTPIPTASSGVFGGNSRAFGSPDA